MKTIKANFKVKKNEHIYYMPDNEGKIESLYFEDSEGGQEEIKVDQCIIDYLNLVKEDSKEEGEDLYKDSIKKCLGLD
jgi:hypothetical protein